MKTSLNGLFPIVDSVCCESFPAILWSGVVRLKPFRDNFILPREALRGCASYQNSFHGHSIRGCDLQHSLALNLFL